MAAARSQGVIPWYYLAIDTAGFVAALAATSGYVRSVTCPKEHAEGMAAEARRGARKEKQRKARRRLEAAMSPHLLEVDSLELEEAATEGEVAELEPELIARARAMALEAVEARRLFKEGAEARRLRREEARRQLQQHGAPAPLKIDTNAFQLAIDEVRDAAPGAAPGAVGASLDNA